jgi:iron-sulfur cluster assembly protein
MITLTDKAIKEVKRVMEDLPEATNTLLRVGVSGGGCSGFEYKLGFVEQSEYSEKTHNKYEQSDVTIIVEKKAELFINGITIDWHEDSLKRGFVFNNPNTADSCGGGSCGGGSCGTGESFSV